jgi:hypothetical protein
MRLTDRAWQLPLRLVPGAYILDSGVGKWDADEETAEHLQEFAATAYPFPLRGAADDLPAVPLRW